MKQFTASLVFTFFTILLNAQCPSGQRLYVDANAPQFGQDGSSWANAYRYLLVALRVANTCPNVQEIWIRSGRYVPEGNTPHRDSSFIIKRGGLKIYGGFYGDETSLTQRHGIGTTLSGDYADNDYAPTNYTENSYHVLVIAGIAANADSIVLDGLEIKNGNANGTGTNLINGIAVSRETGGGLCLMNNYNAGKVTIHNCSFIQNYTDNNGAGMYISNCSPNIINCTFKANSQGQLSIPSIEPNGGGIYNESASPNIINCLFSGNVMNRGSGMYNAPASSPQIVNCTFAANNAIINGGAVYNGQNTYPSFVNCIIWGNAYALRNDTSQHNSYPSFSYCNTQDTVQTGVGNISVNPLFKDSIGYWQSPHAGGNFSLKLNSPSINVGNSNAIIPNSTDITNTTPRILQAVADMGAYENIGCTGTNRLYVAEDNINIFGDGSSWANAYKSVIDAMHAVKLCNGIQEVWVKQGTYSPYGSGIVIDKGGIKIYGGFAGDETSIAVRHGNATILNGNSGSGLGFYAEHAVTIAGLLATEDSVVLDGLVIANGNATSSTNTTINGLSISNSIGGGLCIYENGNGSKIAIRNCLFKDNNAVTGGGIYISASGNPYFYNTHFLLNHASNDGGALIIGNTCEPTFVNCTFMGNTAAYYGGAILQYTNANAQYYNCIMGGNKSLSGAALYNFGASPLLYNCTLSGNQATDNTGGNNGGAMYNRLGASPTVINCIFYGNSSEVFNDNSSATCNPIITYSNIQGGFSGSGNINTNPQFVNAPSSSTAPFTVSDYHLQNNSPRNNGNNTVVPFNITKDVTGKTPRILDNVVDMGAVEYYDCHNTLALNGDYSQESIQNGNNYFYDSTLNCLLICSINPGNDPTLFNGIVKAKVTIDATVQTYNGNRYVQRHYDIEPSIDAATATGTIVLYFDNNDFKSFNAAQGTGIKLPDADISTTANIANLHITQFHGKGTAPGNYTGWTGTGPAVVDIIPTGVTWDPINKRWEVEFDVTGFSGFYVKAGAGVLPIKLLDFNGTRQTRYNQLQWATAGEMNTQNFELQSSTDGHNFITIGSIPALGNGGHNYSYNDSTGFIGRIFYRLKMTDTDGHFMYSSIVIINGQNDIAVSIYPNPANDVIHVVVSNDLIGSPLRLYNMHGQLLVSKIISTNNVQLSVGNYSRGIYLVQLQNGTTIKVIKQ